MSTQDNLKAAFAGESQANRKYLAFAKKADNEGLPGVAKLFRAAAEAETVHAHAHLRAMKGIKSTAKNLAEAVGGEHYEFTHMYPEFIAEAEKEDAKVALNSFQNAMAVEKIHHNLYTRALEAVKQNTDFEDANSDIYVCSVCGNTVIGEAPEVCPICGVSHDKFLPID
jgi:rubrerythrin